MYQLCLLYTPIITSMASNKKKYVIDISNKTCSFFVFNTCCNSAIRMTGRLVVLLTFIAGAVLGWKSAGAPKKSVKETVAQLYHHKSARQQANNVWEQIWGVDDSHLGGRGSRRVRQTKRAAALQVGPRASIYTARRTLELLNVVISRKSSRA